MKYRIALMVLSSALSYGAQPFDTLNSLNEYIAHYRAPRNMQGYTTPLTFSIPGWLSSWGIVPHQWSVHLLKELLVKEVHSRTRKGYALEHTLLLQGHTGDQYVVFGPLFGSLHSLVRALNYLHQLGIITQNLLLAKPYCSLVFAGNSIDNSPYVLQTLTVILILMSRNPGRVFYLQGQYEHNQYWHNTQLKAELIRQAAEPLEIWLDRFFTTLPLALYITEPADKQSALSISYFPRLTTLAYEASCGQLIRTKKSADHMPCPLAKQPNGPGALDIKVLVKADDRLVSYVSQPGLILLPPDTGATAWGMFSAPNRFYQMYYHFFYDAFTVITLGNTCDTSSIALYNQDVREQAGFRKVITYNALTGQPLEPLSLSGSPFSELFAGLSAVQLRAKEQQEIRAAQQKTEGKPPIIMGCTLDLSKGVSNLGRQVKDGLSMYVNNLNQAGGINGRRIQVVFMDDEYTPEKARANVENFIKTYKSPLLLCPIGSPTLESYMDLVRQKKIFVFFPVTGAPVFRKPDLTTMVHWRVSYLNEAKILTKYMVDHHQIKSFAFFYQDDAYGNGALIGSRQSLKAAGITKSLEVPYATNTTNFVAAIARLKGAPTDALGFFTTPIAAEEFIRQTGIEFFIGKYLFALSDLSEASVKRFIAEKGLNMVIAEFVPNPKTSPLPIVQEYRDLLQLQGKATGENTFTLEAYIAASLTAEILRQVTDPYDLDSLISIIQRIKQVPFKGLMLTFNPQTHELVHKMWMDIGTPDWLEINTD